MKKSVDFEVMDRCLVIHMKDELDHHSVVSLREESDRLIEKENIKHIVFDFSGVTFMDSSGIGMIMGRYKRVIFAGGKVAVSSVTPAVDRILRISGLYKIMEKHPSVEEAVKAM